MKKTIIAAVFLAGLITAGIYFFTPHEMSKEDMLKCLEKNISAYGKVGEYFVSHNEIRPSYIYEQDSAQYSDIKDDIKKTLDDGFLYIKVSDDHREITFGSDSDSSADHKLIYSPYDKPKSVSNAETTEFGKWYIKM